MNSERSAGEDEGWREGAVGEHGPSRFISTPAGVELTACPVFSPLPVVGSHDHLGVNATEDVVWVRHHDAAYVLFPEGARAPWKMSFEDDFPEVVTYQRDASPACGAGCREEGVSVVVRSHGVVVVDRFLASFAGFHAHLAIRGSFVEQRCA
jgi:hypothetical protein